jgi:adenylate cyclase
MSGPGRAGLTALKALLRERNQSPERAAEIDRRLRETFQRRAAVLVLDMCGFSRLTAKHGIIFYLSMIVQMEDAATPAVLNNNGTVVKQEADNFFALFHHPVDALEAALDVFNAFKAVNSVMPDDRDILGSIGIGYGDMLVAGTEDVYGEEMNAACRLGEDLGQRDEILLTPAAHDALPAGKYTFEPVRYRHGNAEINAFRYVGRSAGSGEDDAPAGASR